MVNTILHKVQSEVRAARPADSSSERTSAPNDAPVSIAPASSAGVAGDAASGVPAPAAPVEEAVDHERSASPAPGRSAAIETPGPAVRDESGGFRQEHWTRHRSHRWFGRRTGSVQRRLPVPAVNSSAKLGRSAHSTPTVPDHQAPWPPKGPGGALNAALGSSSSTLFGTAMAALFILIACEAFGAPRRRSSPPLDRPCSAPFIARLERPG
jgi:hypothetical protein